MPKNVSAEEFVVLAQKGELPENFLLVLDNDALYSANDALSVDFGPEEFIVAVLDLFKVRHTPA
ncbi:hypothetical protein [uncultured Deinococcus sp.]|uniref:hypothetical protein n=1 Tax=uncultured Deinococcus sp. TaxID=158789 RepID=UPI00374A41D3